MYTILLRKNQSIFEWKMVQKSTEGSRCSKKVTKKSINPFWFLLHTLALCRLTEQYVYDTIAKESIDFWVKKMVQKSTEGSRCSKKVTKKSINPFWFLLHTLALCRLTEQYVYDTIAKESIDFWVQKKVQKSTKVAKKVTKKVDLSLSQLYYIHIVQLTYIELMYIIELKTDW